MLNFLWAFMMLIGILWAAFNGNLAQVTGGALDSAKEAVTLAVTMLGVMSFWTGILEVGRRAGLIEQLSRAMGPLLRFLFPDIPKDHPAFESISANLIANVLGLGWAATPAGLKAMEELEGLEEERREEERREEERREEERREKERRERSEHKERGAGRKRGYRPVPRGTASDEMCTFLVVNISSLQLIPINMIAYRAQYGSANPMAIVGPALVATSVSTLVGVAYAKLRQRRRQD